MQASSVSMAASSLAGGGAAGGRGAAVGGDGFGQRRESLQRDSAAFLSFTRDASVSLHVFFFSRCYAIYMDVFYMDVFFFKKIYI